MVWKPSHRCAVSATSGAAGKFYVPLPVWKAPVWLNSFPKASEGGLYSLSHFLLMTGTPLRETRLTDDGWLCEVYGWGGDLSLNSCIQGSDLCTLWPVHNLTKRHRLRCPNKLLPTCRIQELVYAVNYSVGCHEISFFRLQFIHQKTIIHLSMK